MSTPLTSQEEPSAGMTSAEEVAPVATSPQPSSSHPVFPAQGEEEETFYFEQEEPDLESAFVSPFEGSNDIPVMKRSAQASDQSSALPSAPVPVKKAKKVRLSLKMAAILVCLIVIVGLIVVNALGQTTPPLQMRATGSSPSAPAAPQKPAEHQQPPARPTAAPMPTAAQTNGTNGQGQGQPAGQDAPNWIPQRLPDGWMNAGLQLADGIQAIRTAVAFNDREMSLDYRSVGTRTTHGGTFTAATFVMTAAARQRFQHNDVRASSNMLFDMVVTTRLIRLVVNPNPRLVTFTQAGQQQFARVDVAFQLWQSQTDSAHPQQPNEGIVRDPATNQPQVHHMMVLLLHVASQDAGTTPAMGGTGWLVSNYALDQPDGTTLTIVQPA